jgi:hypothetical protein
MAQIFAENQSVGRLVITQLSWEGQAHFVPQLSRRQPFKGFLVRLNEADVGWKRGARFLVREDKEFDVTIKPRTLEIERPNRREPT